MTDETITLTQAAWQDLLEEQPALGKCTEDFFNAEHTIRRFGKKYYITTRNKDHIPATVCDCNRFAYLRQDGRERHGEFDSMDEAQRHIRATWERNVLSAIRSTRPDVEVEIKREEVVRFGATRLGRVSVPYDYDKHEAVVAAHIESR
jgi:hypothetical protein